MVVDLLMPIMGGEEFLRELRRRAGHPGAAGGAHDRGLAQGRGPLPAVDALLVKPFDLEDLLAAVRRFVPSPG